MYSDELIWVSFGPRRENNVPQRHPALLGPQVEVVAVGEEFGQIVELRNELLDVGHVVLTGRTPGIGDAVEETIGKVKMAALGTEKEKQ